LSFSLLVELWIPLLVFIFLALLNGISMIPVAYDDTKAITKPQMLDTGKLVLRSVVYGFLQTDAVLLFIFTLDHAGELGVALEDQNPVQQPPVVFPQKLHNNRWLPEQKLSPNKGSGTSKSGTKEDSVKPVHLFKLTIRSLLGETYVRLESF
jgi:hypothetical protein